MTLVMGAIFARIMKSWEIIFYPNCGPIYGPWCSSCWGSFLDNRRHFARMACQFCGSREEAGMKDYIFTTSKERNEEYFYGFGHLMLVVKNSNLESLLVFSFYFLVFDSL